MKAKQYYNLYKEDLLSQDNERITYAESRIIVSMRDEMLTLLNIRHIKRTSAFYSLVEEMNDKWNAIARICENENGFSPVKRDVYKNTMGNF